MSERTPSTSAEAIVALVTGELADQPQRGAGVAEAQPS